MKKIIATAVALAFSGAVLAQGTVPPPNPKAEAAKAAGTKSAPPAPGTMGSKVEKVLGPKEGKAAPTDAERKAARDKMVADKKAKKEAAAAEKKAKKESAAAAKKAKKDAAAAAKKEKAEKAAADKKAKADAKAAAKADAKAPAKAEPKK